MLFIHHNYYRLHHQSLCRSKNSSSNGGDCGSSSIDHVDDDNDDDDDDDDDNDVDGDGNYSVSPS